MGMAAIFPGQGAQSVGMLSDLATVHSVIEERFDEASQVLGFDLWDMVQQGPAELLGQTENTQPALLAASVALWELWPNAIENVDVLCGHSLGEYSALVCAGALSFGDAVKLVRIRGELMQQEVPSGAGGMAAILGLDDDVIERCCGEVSGEVGPANYNAPGQVVIAGETAAVDAAIEACSQAGARRAVSLDVSGPFHSVLMKPAATALDLAISEIELNMPIRPVVQNVRADIASDVVGIRERLVEQLYSPVRWTDCVHGMLEQGVDQFVECGPGGVLAGLIKRISRATPTRSLQKPDDLDHLCG